jgi:predicted amidohydrolase YtcJ
MQVFKGKIISLDRHNTIHRYLVEDQGRIVFLGDSLPDVYKAFPVVELENRALIPSFGDGHMHFSNWALIAVSYFDVRQAEDIPEIQEIIRSRTSGQPKKKAVIAFGVSRHSVREKRLIRRDELDAACPDIPLIIVCYDGHSAVCNTKMIEKFPDRVKKLRGFDAPNGHLFNEAYLAGTDYAAALVPPMDLVSSIMKSYDFLAEKGLGLIHATEGIGFPKDLDVTMVSLIARAAARKNRIQTRLFFQTMDVDKAMKRSLPRIGGCFAAALDGCFGACDAALHEPYSHDPTNTGILFQDEKTVMEFAKKANRNGLQIEMHAIGDAAVSRGVRAIEAALEDFPREDHRHTLIHACLMNDEDMRKIAELKIGITLQPAFLISSLEPVSYLESILGERVRKSSPINTMMGMGIHVSGGSDAPVTHPDPIEGIYAACNHPYDPLESVSIENALRMFTCEVARTTFDDSDRGSLETGKAADMVILNRDPLAMNPKDLRELKVESLYLAGKPYESGLTLPGTLWHGVKGRKDRI